VQLEKTVADLERGIEEKNPVSHGVSHAARRRH
jgi:hypothetical protein